MHAIEGIPKNCQILHVEQEVVGDDTSALQCVLNSDVERAHLLGEEARLLKIQVIYITACVCGHSKKTCDLQVSCLISEMT